MNLLKTLLYPILAPVSEADGGGGVAADEKIETQEADTPEAAVLSELGLDESSSTEDQSVAQEAKDEKAATSDAADTPAKPDPVKDEKAEAEAKPKADAEKKEGLTDADLAPLESKNQSTNERFRKVTEGYKQEKQRAEAAVADVEKYKSSFDSLKQLGFNDERAADDLVMFAGFRNVVASGDVDAFKQIIASQIKQFEQLHGKRVSVQASALDDHPDLQKQISEFNLTEDAALELAKARAATAREEQTRKSQEQVQADQQQHQTVMNESIAQVNAMEANWKKTDPDAAALLPHLKAQMEDIARKFPAAQWPVIVEMQYKALKKAMAETVSNTATARPLRAAGHTAGLLEPNNPQDAVLQALGLDG